MSSKRRNSKKSKQGRRSGGNSPLKMVGRIVRVPFNTVYTSNFTAQTSSTVNINASAFDTLLANIQPNFEFYRFTKLSFKALPVAQTYAISYLPSSEATPQTNISFADTILAGCNKLISSSQTTPVTMVIPRSLLYLTPEDWWSTNSSSSIPVQGRFVIATPTSATATFYIQVWGMIEYKAPVHISENLTIPKNLTFSVASVIPGNKDQKTKFKVASVAPVSVEF